MYLLIFTIPFFSFLLIVLIGRKMSSIGLKRLLVFNSWLAPLVVCNDLYEVMYIEASSFTRLRSYLYDSFFEFAFDLMFDYWTMIMAFIVTSISAIVITYAIAYMIEDPHQNRFMSYLFLFSFFMLLFVLARNYILLFLGWEGVGLVSYLLIGFFFSRTQANKAAIKAIFVNRFGDFTLFIALLFIIHTCRTTDISMTMLVLENVKNEVIVLSIAYESLVIIATSLVIAAMGKSAQLPLHIWLPDAMEGPTPVSALLHAATMVTAGIFIVIRTREFYSSVDWLTHCMIFISCLTMVYSAIVASYQTDVKKMVAYSTCSQLGYMMAIFFLGGVDITIYHLLTHAFFKALLFTTLGIVLHSIDNEQDVRRLGGLIKVMPLSYIFIILGSLALAGLPFLAGFFSKDAIIESAYCAYSYQGVLTFLAGILAAYFTAFYSIRLLFSTFISGVMSFKKLFQQVNEGSGFLIWPLLLLALGSIITGLVFHDILVGFGSHMSTYVQMTIPVSKLFLELEFIPIYIKQIPFFIIVSGFFQAIQVELVLLDRIGLFWSTFYLLSFYSFSNLRWFFDIIYNHIIITRFLDFNYYIIFKLLDRGLFEFIGPTGIEYLLYQQYLNMFRIVDNTIFTYLLSLIIGFVMLLLLVFIEKFVFILCIIVWIFLFILK